MAERQKYDFPDTISGATFDGVQFTVIKNTLPLDLTGSRIDMVMGKTPMNVKTEFSTENGTIEIIDPENGVFQFKQQVVNLADGRYSYELLIMLADGEVKSYIYGSWNILPGVSFCG